MKTIGACFGWWYNQQKAFDKDSGSLLSLIDQTTAVFRNAIKDEITTKIVEERLSKNKFYYYLFLIKYVKYESEIKFRSIFL